MTLPENRKPLLWKDIPFSERPKTHPSSWEGEAKISRITISRLEARVAELEVALGRLVTAVVLGRLVTAVEDGCFCSEMEMATRIDEARVALKGQDDE